MDHLVDVDHRDGQAHQRVATVAGAPQQEAGAPHHHLLAERDEGGQHLAQVHQLRAAMVQRQRVDPERGLQRGEPVELVQHHFGRGVALELDHHAQALPVAFVAQLGDALDPLLARQLADALAKRGLVHLVGHRSDDDRLAPGPLLLDLGRAAEDHGSPAGHQRRARAAAADDLAAGREVRTRHDVEQRLERDVRIVDQRQAGVDHLAQIVRRDAGRHADGDAARAVDQQVGDARRQHRGLALLAVVVVLELDRAEVDVGHQRFGRLGQAALGVAHVRRRIGVDGAEVALAVDQRQAHRERLGHAHQRVVDGRIPVGVVLADHVADDARRLHVGPVRGVPLLVHREQDSPVHRLEAVAHVRQRPGDDDAHRV